jgi:hypoxanthine phosphoribosyltransferase
MRKLDWNEYHGYIDQLAQQIKEITKDNPYRHLFAIDVDDQIVAAHLSHKLNASVVNDISLLVYLYNMSASEHDTLLVSNIVRTGNSFNSIMKQCDREIDTAVLFKDSKCDFDPTYFVDIPEKFIIFPWEDKKEC